MKSVSIIKAQPPKPKTKFRMGISVNDIYTGPTKTHPGVLKAQSDKRKADSTLNQLKQNRLMNKTVRVNPSPQKKLMNKTIKLK